MKNLIEEIEGLKVNEAFGTGEYSFGLLEGINKGINNCIELLTQYNIIPAPKQIKLSEVLDKIGYDDIQIKRDNHLIFVKNSDGLLFTVDFNKLLPCRFLDYVCYGKLKWLYTLWIAGSEIIDDLEDL